MIDRNELLSHSRAEHAARMGVFTCQYCGAEFPSPIHLRKHEVAAHQPRQGLPPGAPVGAAEFESIVQEAFTAHSQRQPREAHSLLEKALKHQAAKSHPSAAKVWYMFGVVSNELGLLEPARDAYLKVVEQDWSASDAHCNLGRTFEMLGEYERAKHHLEACVAANPESAAGMQQCVC